MGHVNEASTELQGKGSFAHELYCIFMAFMTKLLLLSRQVKKKQLFQFLTLRFVTKISKKYSSLLIDLHFGFTRRFQDL